MQGKKGSKKPRMNRGSSEAQTGFEPVHQGVADPRLTTDADGRQGIHAGELRMFDIKDSHRLSAVRPAVRAPERRPGVALCAAAVLHRGLQAVLCGVYAAGL